MDNSGPQGLFWGHAVPLVKSCWRVGGSATLTWQDAGTSVGMWVLPGGQAHGGGGSGGGAAISQPRCQWRAERACVHGSQQGGRPATLGAPAGVTQACALQ